MRILCSFWVLLFAGLGFAGPEEFRVVSVRVRVRDGAGQPAKGAQVYACSEFWRIRFPIDGTSDKPGPATADGNGQCVLRLPIGRYTFCAAPGWDALMAGSGRGFFLASPGQDVQKDDDVVLAPDATVRVAVDPDGYPDMRSARLMASPEGWGPTIGPLAGATPGAQATRRTGNTAHPRTPL